MESLEKFEESKKELMRIDKESCADEFVINISKLDSISKERLLLAIRQTISDRVKDIDRVVLGIKNDYQN